MSIKSPLLRAGKVHGKERLDIASYRNTPDGGTWPNNAVYLRRNRVGGKTFMAREVNSDTFEKEVVQAQLPVLVDFWGPRCAPCLALMPHVEGLAEKYGERVKITTIDASKNRRLCLSLKVLGLPTYLFYKNGKEIERLTGGDLTINDIEESLKKMIE